MGCISSGCLGKQNERNHLSKTFDHSRFHPLQVQMLKLIFKDLSDRCPNQMISREVFDTFFHSNGVIGQIIFLKFDIEKKGMIDLNSFLLAFELMIKGTKKQKADVLFELYNIDKSGFIEYDELLKILFSYPLQSLNKILVQSQFLQYIGQSQFSYYFGNQNKIIQDKNILEQESSQQINNNNKQSNHQIIVSSTVYNGSHKNLKESKKSLISSIKNMANPINQKREMIKQQHLAQSMLINAQKQKNQRRNIKIVSNIYSLTKKYAQFLFKSYHLDRQKDKFSKEHFFTIIQEHPTLFDTYLSGFHIYIWQIKGQQPQYLSIKPQMEGKAKYQNQDEIVETVYLKLIKTTLFVFSHIKSKIPREIIILQGLDVMEFKGQKQQGIIIRHRDGRYQMKKFYFLQESKRKEWAIQLSQLKQNSLNDFYIILQRIGGGSFSDVYRGKDKITNAIVAIKKISIQNLHNLAKQIIKRQCGIMKQCHHPNIIKFIGQFKTKANHYIVMQLMQEGDLFDYTRRNRFLEQYQAAIIFKQLVDAILYLNKNIAVIHRDLKPENIMIQLNADKTIVKKIKLIDFGFAIFKDKITDLPEQQLVAGTPGFVAPQILLKQIFDEKIDTFGLGIVLYFMLSGYLPFQATTNKQILKLTKQCNYSIVNAHWANISDNAKDLIRKTLAFKQKRISTKQIADHPWLKNLDQLKEYIGSNQRMKSTLIIPSKKQ